MDPKALADLATKAMAAIKDQDGDTALTLLEQLITLLMGGAPADDSATSTPDASTAEGGDPQPAAAASTSANSAVGPALAKMLGVQTEADAVVLFAGLKADVEALRAQAHSADLTARRGLIAQLVKLGVETPATAWAGVPDKMIPCKRLMAESLDEMKARVAVFSARGPSRNEAVDPPLGSDDAELTAHEREIADKIADPTTKARFIALRKSRKVK